MPWLKLKDCKPGLTPTTSQTSICLEVISNNFTGLFNSVGIPVVIKRIVKQFFLPGELLKMRNEIDDILYERLYRRVPAHQSRRS